ncbi:T9SS type A sorting domain-containing protein [Apibacter muscae]|uniref:T9SS type A sorting domain-containing protein n=1 Tax=Apibacter muscae TaxID=2509004 RepID=UPI0011ACA1D7|nr:T9SS type A sorting domain-containing protein [Apibacter muscae]TWP30181.1 T9SS type A sorting domain-containing protein [Apibacter muscae]
MLFFLFSLLSYSQKLGYDKTYGENGIVQLQPDEQDDYPYSYQTYEDGKILIASNNGIFRLNSDYTLDTSFATNGRIKNIINAKIFLLFDKKILAITTENDNTSFKLQRFLADGTSDKNYGTNGEVTYTNLGYIGSTIQKDDKVLVTCTDNQNKLRYLLRIGQDGYLDSSFGAQGKALIPNIFTRLSTDIVSKSLGEIIISGSDFFSSNSFQALQFTSNGSIDKSFGTEDGLLSINDINDSSFNAATNIKIKTLKDGNLLFFANVETVDGILKVIVQKTTPDGKKILFNKEHIQIDNFFFQDLLIKEITELNNGNLLFSGSTDSSMTPNISYYLLDAKGDIVENFGIKGVLSFNHSSPGSMLNESTIGTIEKNNGDLISIGNYQTGTKRKSKLALYKFNVKGEMDSSFGTQGVLMFGSKKPVQKLTSIILQKEDKILFSSNDSRIVRIDNQGKIDGSYFQIENEIDNYDLVSSISNDDNIIGEILPVSFVTSPVGKSGSNIILDENGNKINYYGIDGLNQTTTIIDMIKLPNGRYLTNLVYKNGNDTGRRLLISDINGSNDKTIFNTYSNINNEKIYSLILQNEDKFLFIKSGVLSLGHEFDSGARNQGIYRCNFNGEMDPTFQPKMSFLPDNLLVQPDYKIIGIKNNLISRWLQNGDIDATFGNNGTLNLNELLSEEVNVYRYTIRTDNKLIFVIENSKGALEVIRLNTDGSLDSSFANQGKYTVDHSKRLISLKTQSDDKLLLLYLHTDGYYEMIRLHAEGQLDTTFTNQGKISFEESLNLQGLLLQSNDQPLVFGTQKIEEDEYITFIRISNQQFIAPKGEILEDQEVLRQNEPITFSLQTTGEPIDYLWRFEDGSNSITSTESHPVVTFKSLGVHKIHLTVTYSDSYISDIEKNILIEENESTEIILNPKPEPDTSISSETRVSPNPTHGVLNFKMKGNTKKVEVQILDLSGRQIAEYSFVGEQGNINIQHLTSGVYFIKLSSEEFSNVQKIIKN